MNWKVQAEVLWKSEPEIEDARKLPGWSSFHRECGKRVLFFDHMTRDGRRGAWSCDAFTLRGTDQVKLATGKGKTVVASVLDALAQSGIAVPGVADLLTQVVAAPADEDEFANLLPPAAVADDDDFEGLI
ncbi:hypothetical protein U1872_06305 [Sphingomonas sp. RB3P16]|uniref:hypothetical protein n=1 Tax=Parasphingomonas frigoris TaxID=3096163 RepID=UPI002FCC4936